MAGSPTPAESFSGSGHSSARRDLHLLRNPLGERTVEPATASAQVVQPYKYGKTRRRNRRNVFLNAGIRSSVPDSPLPDFPMCRRHLPAVCHLSTVYHLPTLARRLTLPLQFVRFSSASSRNNLREIADKSRKEFYESEREVARSPRPITTLPASGIRLALHSCKCNCYRETHFLYFRAVETALRTRSLRGRERLFERKVIALRAC